MEFRRVFALRGPNIWARYPVLEAWVNLGDLKDSSSDEIPGFNERLKSWLPTLIEHRCSEGVRGGFFERLRRGTYLAHILEHVTIELQTLAGTSVGFGKARETSEEGVYKVVVRYQDETLARACLFAARELCLAAVYDRPYDVLAELKKLRDLADRVCLGPSTAAIVQAAQNRKIPFRRLNSGSLIQLGYGARQRRIWTAETDQTGAIAESIAQDKELSKSLLRAVGVPVPEGRTVEDPDDAWAAACEIGLPVVVKPRDANHGRGLFMNLTTKEQVMEAFPHSAKEGSGVMVERFAPGVEHRLLVVGNRLIAAARGEEAAVIGDGVQTVAELIESQLNSDPRRGEDENCLWDKIIHEPVVIAEINYQGYELDSVPANGVRVLVQRNGNLTADVTDKVHPNVAARAVLAAQVVGLNVAGLDVVATDISRPLEEQGGVFVEVNAGPGLLMHLRPTSGTPQPVGEAIIDTLFPNGENGRIPIVAITGTNGKTTTTRLIAEILRQTGKTVGMTCTDGIFVDGRRIEKGDCSGPRSARSVLLNPKVEVAAFEVARGGILREGLGFDLCDVAVVTNLGEGDHLGMSYIDDLEKMVSVKRSAVDVVMPHGAAVLNAADPPIAEMARLSAGGVIFFALRPDEPVIVAHREQGGKAVFARDGMVVLADGQNERTLIPLARIPSIHQGCIPFQTENVLAAVGAAWALNVSDEKIRAGLETFAGEAQQSPGRFNVFEYNSAVVILDDAHNSSALAALVRSLDQFPQRQRTIVYAVEGDRRDVDAIRQGELLGASFDRVIVYESDAHCGRADGEMTALVRRGLETGERVAEILEIGSPKEAVIHALRSVRPGELLVIQPDVIEETLGIIRRVLAGEVPEASDVLAPGNKARNS